jgi:hypothetical protein
MFHSYDYFSLSVSFSEIIDSLRGFAQRVRSVDDRCQLSGFNELLKINQILIRRKRNRRVTLLAHEQ